MAEEREEKKEYNNKEIGGLKREKKETVKEVLNKIGVKVWI